MSPYVAPIFGDERLPERADVVIVGGGIVGCATALELSERGVSVLLCEKGAIGAEQSSRNWGWCRQMGRDPREIPLMIESLSLWRGMDKRLGAETGFSQTGIVYLAADEDTLAKRATWLEYARQHGIDTRVLTSVEVSQLMRTRVQNCAGGLYTSSDGHAEPALATPAIAQAARRAGASIMTGCAVRGVETSCGRVSAVVTEIGKVACNAVVVAGGAWSGLLLASLGLKLPQLQVVSSVQRTAAQSDLPDTTVGGPGYSFCKRADGGYTIAPGGESIHEITRESFRFFFDFLPALNLKQPRIHLRLSGGFTTEWKVPRRWKLDEVSPFERIRILDPNPSRSMLDKALTKLRRAFPAFEAVHIVERWAGTIDVTPDVVPVISPTEKMPGLFIATGFSGHGFGIAPGAGRLMADLVTGDRPLVNPAPFHFSRFSERPRPRPFTVF